MAGLKRFDTKHTEATQPDAELERRARMLGQLAVSESTTKRRPKVDLSEMEVNLNMTCEPTPGWSQLWTKLLEGGELADYTGSPQNPPPPSDSLPAPIAGKRKINGAQIRLF